LTVSIFETLHGNIGEAFAKIRCAHFSKTEIKLVSEIVPQFRMFSNAHFAVA
jgi:hypothetical protein